MIDARNLARELEKIRDVVGIVDAHLGAKDKMNAALHMSVDNVRPTPLAAAVATAHDSLCRLIADVES